MVLSRISSLYKLLSGVLIKLIGLKSAEKIQLLWLSAHQPGDSWDRTFAHRLHAFNVPILLVLSLTKLKTPRGLQGRI